LNRPNLIAIFAEGNTIALYVNRHRIASIQDSSYTQGNLGLAADEDNKPTEVVYSNAKVWIL
jgi:eukaryotic-like serine/threonine-protein kinase